VSILNGYWRFCYSDEQKEMNKDNGINTYVKIEDGWEEYTETVHISHTQQDDYKPHERRFEDSVEVGIIEKPKIKKERG